MFLTAFGDEIVKLAQQAPWTPPATPAQKATRERQKMQGVKVLPPENPWKYRSPPPEPGAPYDFGPTGRGSILQGTKTRVRPNPGHRRTQDKEKKLNPPMSDLEAFKKGRVRRVSYGGRTIPQALGPDGKETSIPSAFQADQANLAKRNQKLYRTHAFKGKLETKAEKIQKGVPSTKPDPKPSKAFVRSPMVDRVMGRPSPPRFKQKLESQAEKIPGYQ
jgi:hypothetical protein